MLSGMKADEKIGVNKEIDKLGRLVIPKEMRDMFNFGKQVELVVTEYGVPVRNPKFVLVAREEGNKLNFPPR